MTDTTLPCPPECEVCDQCFGDGQYEGAVCGECDGKGHFPPPASSLAYGIAVWLYGTYDIRNSDGENVGTDLIARTIQEVMDREGENDNQ